jgi:hypothetical protein
MTYETVFYPANSEIDAAVSGLISAVSVLQHQHNTEDEIKVLRDCIPLYFKQLDRQNVTFRFQNACIYIAEKFDVREYYMRTLVIKAVEHAGGYDNIYRRSN